MAILITINQLSNPNMLFVGQILKLPGPPRATTPAVKTLPDAAFIRGPASGNFDLADFIAQLPGYLRDYYEQWVYGAAEGGVNSEMRSAAQIIESVSLEYSIDARILLTLLEYRGRWLSDALPDAHRLSQPIVIGSAPPRGLYHQLSWAADWLNRGYYGWRYGSLTSLTALSGERYRIATGLNAASVALQTLYSQINPAPRWQQDVSSEGFVSQYRAYFGDPFTNADDATIPSHLKQPSLSCHLPEVKLGISPAARTMAGVAIVPGERWISLRLMRANITAAASFPNSPHGQWPTVRWSIATLVWSCRIWTAMGIPARVGCCSIYT